MPGWLARVTAVLVAAVTSFATALPASAEKRIALVVGNGAYQSLTPLRNAVNDARAVKGALEELGFTVIDGENLSRRGLNEKIAALESSIKTGDTVFLYFSGHGVALGADNYLISVDMPAPESGGESMVRNEGHGADALIRSIQEHGAATTFVVLDACRNNPIQSAGKSVGLGKGLARMDPPRGVFVLFAAGTGQTALDRLSETDPEPNSVFTRKLVPLLKTPGLTHIDLAKRLQTEVAALASTSNRHVQEPAYYDQINGYLVLKEGPNEPAPPAASPPPSPSNEAAIAWGAVKESEDPTVLEAFVKRYGDTFFADLAKARIDRLKREKQANLAPPPKPEPAVRPEAPKPEPARPAPPGTDMAPGTVFRDCPECPEMVVVPAGSFTMGSPESEEGRSDDEGPQRKVTIAKAFAVGKFEVTFDEWDACVSAGGCKHVPGDAGWGRGNRPVIHVSWDDAKQYVAWLSKKTGKIYRLLTEAEWEYAARAGTATTFSTGKSITTDQANFDGDNTYGGSSKGEDRRKTVEAGSFQDNAFGLFDMHGNVQEWVEDCYKDTYQGAPIDGSANLAGDCGRRVLRGGSWDDFPRFLRSAGRVRVPTVVQVNFFGFRVGRTLD